MLHRLLAVVLCAVSRPPTEISAFIAPAPTVCVAGVRGPRLNGMQMTSGLIYASALPAVAHPSLALGSLVEVRFGGRVVEGIVLDNLLSDRRVDVEISPFLARRLGVLHDSPLPVTLVVVGCEPRSRWIHAIGALTP